MSALSKPEAHSVASLLDRFIPHPDLRIRHQTVIRAPAALVFQTAQTFDLRTARLVRAIFWMRGVILGAKAIAPDWSLGFVPVMLGMGWGALAQEPDRWFVAGTVCQPWLADVVMKPISSEEFADYSEPNQVKIIWTLEAEPRRELIGSAVLAIIGVALIALAPAKQPVERPCTVAV